MERHRKEIAKTLVLATALIAAVALALLPPQLQAQSQTTPKGFDPKLLAKASAGDDDAQTSSGFAGAFHNGRLKLLSLPDRPIVGGSRMRVVEGVWVSESSGSGKALVFPEQVKISCEDFGPDDKKCVELSVTLAPTSISVGIMGLNTEEYAIDRWDDRGVIASYGGDRNGSDLSSKCHRHVLTMDFASGTVSVSDIPTHMKGCEAFTTTNSYRLVQGEYYVDTTPNNDGDKPIEKAK